MPTFSLVDILVWLPATALFIYVLWTRSRWPRPPWLKMLNPLAFWLFILWLFLTAGACLNPSLSHLLAILCAFSLFAAHFMYPAIPHRLPRTPNKAPRLCVMTANLYKRNEKVKDILQTIIAEAPDVLALQELKEEHVQAIGQNLRNMYPYQMLYPGKESEGMGLISRYPFQSPKTCILTPGANPTQLASIQFANRRIWILNVHPRIPHLEKVKVAGITFPIGLNSQERQKDIEAVIEVAAELEEDTVMMGDMNTTSQCEEYQLIPPHWQNAHEETGWGLGLTYPVDEPFFGVPLPFPFFRIDHIFYRGELEAITCHTGKMPGSDHRYLITDLLVKTEGIEKS